MKSVNKVIKRIFDIVFSFIGIIILSPLLLVVSICIKLDSKGNVIFKQVRVGKDKKEFYIFKFRTMIVDAEKYGKQITVANDNRITRVGNILRRYKIDELPQLFNVFLGTMSFVGPRPEVKKYVSMYTGEQEKVFDIKPGITDLASIRYSDENDILSNVHNPEGYYINSIMPDKLKLNLEYINNNNLLIDIKIILKTIMKCFK